MNRSALLPEGARDKIDVCPPSERDSVEVRKTAAGRLADRVSVGPRDGVTPAEWAEGAALPTSCLDTCRERHVRMSRLTALSPQNPLTVETGPAQARGRAR
jgi:hypothetical protein